MSHWYQRAATLVLLSLPVTAAAHGVARASEDNPDRYIRFPDTASHMTLVVDLHTHSVFSDGHVWPKIRVEEALRDGLDALAVTEHLEYQPHRGDIPHPNRNQAFIEASSAAEGSNLIVIAGTEITREAPAGHINAVFIDDANTMLNVPEPPEDPRDTLAYYQAANAWGQVEPLLAAQAQGAFVFWNHPYWTRQKPDGIARITDFHIEQIGAGRLHGIEIANGQDYSEEAFAIGLEHNLTLIGVSDVHDLVDWDYAPDDGGHRPVTLLFTNERTPEAMRSALLARQTVVWFKNLLIGRPDVLGPLLDACLQIVSAEYRPETEVLDLTIVNRSDADFRLRNTSDITFMGNADLITVPQHGSSRLSVKPGAIVSEISLQFDVLNALTAPKVHPSIQLKAEVPPPAETLD